MTTPVIKYINSYQYQGAPPERVAANPLPEYATYIPDRRPAFKPHNTIGQAKNAIGIKEYSRWRDGGFRHDMAIYRLFGTEYEMVLKIAKGSKRADYPELAPPPPTAQQIKRREDSERRANEARLTALRAQADALEATLK